MAKLSPVPTGVPPGHSYWNDWYEKLRTLINNMAEGFTWGAITGKPTTIAGYGITDAIASVGDKDIVITDPARGLVLTDTAATPHYWRLSIVAGNLTVTDLGTTPP